MLRYYDSTIKQLRKLLSCFYFPNFQENLTKKTTNIQNHTLQYAYRTIQLIFSKLELLLGHYNNEIVSIQQILLPMNTHNKRT